MDIHTTYKGDSDTKVWGAMPYRGLTGLICMAKI